jgi:hypothetical protein
MYTISYHVAPELQEDAAALFDITLNNGQSNVNEEVKITAD